MNDRRNWKCFIGMHQFNQLDEPKVVDVYDPVVSMHIPVNQKVVYTMKCEFCGKITSKKVKL